MRLLALYSFLTLLACQLPVQTMAQAKSDSTPSETAKKAAQDFFTEEQRKKNAAQPDSTPLSKTAQHSSTTESVPTNLGNKNADSVLLPEAPSSYFDAPTKEKYLTAMREYYDYRVSGYQHRKRVFEWQLVSSKIIFVVVTLLVLIGLYFSWVQFRSSLRRQITTSQESQEGKPQSLTSEGPVTELEATLSGVRISSPILGVIILIVSFLFFYLYLVYVYPISEIF